MNDVVALVRASRGGDLAAYETLVRRFQDMAYGYARSRLGDAHLAEDATQEAFLRAYRRLGELRKPAAFAGWLRRIIHSQCNRIMRQRKHQAISLSPTDSAADSNPGPSDRAQADELADRVMRAIADLPDTQREVTTLFYVNGYSYAEVASFLDKPISTVKSRLHTARQKLTKELIEMVKDTLHDQKPGPELPQKVIRRLMADAKEARDSGDYARLLSLCDQALQEIEQVGSSARRQADEMDLHTWRAEAHAFGVRDAKAATADYARALELAEELGDQDGQRKALRALLLTCGSAGDWKAMARWARQGLKLTAGTQADGEAAGRLRGQCEAALDLAGRPRHHWKPGTDGGFTIGSVAIERRDGRRWMADPRALRKPGPRDILVNLSQGMPAYISVLMFLRPVLNSMPKMLRVGAVQEARIEPISTREKGAKDLGVKHVLVKTVCEATDETVKTPAGRFEGCRKLTTTMAVPEDVKPALQQHEYLVGILSGTITSWIAPGVGLVKLAVSSKLRFKPECDAVLAAMDIRRRGAQLLPLQEGNTWRYHWTGQLGIQFDEICRVIDASRSRWRIATSTDVTQQRQDKPSKKAHKGESPSDRLRRRLEKGPRQNQDAVRHYGKLLAEAQAGPKDLVPLARFKLASALHEAGETEQADEQFHSLLEDQGGNADPRGAANCLDWLAHKSMADGRHAWAVQAARRGADAWRATGLKDQVADGCANVLLAELLVGEGDPDRVAGFTTAGIELPRRARAVEIGGGGYNNTYLADALRGRPWWMACGLVGGKCLLLPPRPGQTWRTTGNCGGSGQGVRRMVRFTVESDSETIAVPAGRFTKCACVGSEADLSPFMPATKLDDALLGWVRGPRRDWYAPGVGVVRAEHQHANGQVTRLALREFHVKGGQQSYFPARVGNQWLYDWIDDGGQCWGRTAVEVASRYRTTGYLAFASYWLKPV